MIIKARKNKHTHVSFINLKLLINSFTFPQLIRCYLFIQSWLKLEDLYDVPVVVNHLYISTNNY